MKKIFTLLSVCMLLLMNVQVSAQGVAVENINNALVSANDILSTVKNEKKAVSTLVKQIVVLNNPNVTQFLSVMTPAHNVIVDQPDNINYFMSLAYDASPTFNRLPIQTRLDQIVGIDDDVIFYTQQAVAALQSNNNNAAIQALSSLSGFLNSQQSLINQVITRLNNIKNALPRFYDVCITLTDSYGNPVQGSDLFGYYGQNIGTGEYLYPDNQEGTCFTQLPAGTYIFDSFDGYWSGTGATQVTLSDALVNENGIIEVTLIYWSE
jgi:hypothetical protein